MVAEIKRRLQWSSFVSISKATETPPFLAKGVTQLRDCFRVVVVPYETSSTFVAMFNGAASNLGIGGPVRYVFIVY